MAAGHPDPSFVSTNNDRFSTWYGHKGIFVPPSVTAIAGLIDLRTVYASYLFRGRARSISQPDDTFVMMGNLNGAITGQQVIYNMTVNTRVRLK